MDGLEDRHGGANGALGVVLVGLGIPNAAITASPANFSTMPPCVAMHCETCSKKELTRRRTISGSLAVTNAVEPTRSTKSTVASLRSTL